MVGITGADQVEGWDWADDPNHDIAYEGTRTDTGASEAGIISLGELNDLDALFVAIDSVLADDPVDMDQLNQLLAAAQSMASDIGGDAPIFTDILNALGAFYNPSSPIGSDALKEIDNLTFEGRVAVSQIKPPLPMIMLQLFALDSINSVTEDLSAAKDYSDHAKTLQSDLEEVMNEINSESPNMADLEEAIEALKTSIATVDSDPDFASFIEQAEEFIDLVEGSLLCVDGSGNPQNSVHGSTFSQRMEAFASGLLKEGGYVGTIDASNDDVIIWPSGAGDNLVSEDIINKMNQSLTTITSVSEKGVQNISELTSKLEKITQLVFETMKTLFDALKKISLRGA